MNGKVLKVVEYNLTFGSTDRMVNVFGCFKYKKNNGLYLVYSDVNTPVPLVYYGSSHIKENSILSMECKDKAVEDIIKEYLFKVTSKESLDNFEIISLENINGIEIISSNRLEVKPEVINSLVDLTIPKPKVDVEEVSVETKPKKKGHKLLLVLVLLIVILGGGYLYISTMTPRTNVSKSIVCTKKYQHDELTASVDEEVVYKFNYQDVLEGVDTTRVYQFNEEDYLDFINKGTYFKYMPDTDVDGGWDKDDNNYQFKIITKEGVSSSYKLPVNYEEVLSTNRKEGYTCEENIEE